jgi:2Fe-2S ferredoxin
MEEITIFVISEGIEKALKIPLGISMSLMEALKAYDEPIAGTCGGMALCASCQIEVLDNGFESTGNITADEANMLDSLPEYHANSRLACQIKITEAIDGLRISYLQPELVS